MIDRRNDCQWYGGDCGDGEHCDDECYEKGEKVVTDAELAEAWAKIMGYEEAGVAYLIDGIPILKSHWNPLTDWSDWGLCYEWMKRRGWKSSHTVFEDEWWWSKWDEDGDLMYEFVGRDPDIRRAMLLSGLKAEGKGE